MGFKFRPKIADAFPSTRQTHVDRCRECRAPEILGAEMSASAASDSILSVREWPLVHSITPKRRYRDTVHWSQKAPLLIDNGTYDCMR